MKEFIFTSFDDTKLNCTLWDDVKEPKGVIQIIHGMNSYAAMYDDFAKILNNHNYIVFADDHRGHGMTAGKEKLGQVGKDNFMNCVKDQIEFTKMLKEKYNLPVQLFAHSYGSFLAQRYIQLAGNLISGVILSGSAYMGGKRLILGKIITAVQSLFFDINKKDKLLYKMTYKSNNKPFLSDNLDNAWINRNLEKVKQFNDDPLCGYIVSIGFYYSLMRGLIECYIKQNLEKIPLDLPIFIMSGALDPLGEMGKKVEQLYELYENIGIKNLAIKIYDNVRHELTGDPDQDKIISQMLDFYNKNALLKE
ncbi:MAG: alpha/beta fold hydrolase [Bacillota bacterium]